MSNLGKSVGACVKGVGSATPQIAVEQYQPDEEQFKVGSHYDGTDWWISIAPGWVEYVASQTIVSSAGNRDVIDGDRSVGDSDDLGVLKMVEVNQVDCYRALRYGSVANNLKLGQQYKVTDNVTYVFLYSPYPGDGVRLAVTSQTVYETYFRYYTGAGLGADWGCTATIQIRSGSELTVTKNGSGLVTDVAISTDSKSYWERLALLVRPIAKFNKTTGEITQYNIGAQTLDYVSETYGAIVDYVDVVDAPAYVDGNWAAYFYLTTAPNAPANYTFAAGTYTPPS